MTLASFPAPASTVADSFSPKRIPVAFSLAADVGRSHLDFAPEDVCSARTRAVDLDAKLGAKIGHDGGGSADGEEGIRD